MVKIKLYNSRLVSMFIILVLSVIPGSATTSHSAWQIPTIDVSRLSSFSH